MWRSAALCSLLTACGAALAAPPRPHPAAIVSASLPVASAAAKRARSPVLLVVVVDQLASWVFEERAPSLAADGAFARLMAEGVFAPQLRYEHATTSTAPGHAALFTGLVPRESGVFANERPDPAGNKPVSVFHDEAAHVVQERVLEATSSSPALLRADTLADALRAQHPDAQIVALSLKDRAAIPGGGRHPDAAVWFDPKLEGFVTSTAFAGALPSWAASQNAKLEAALTSSWAPLDPAWLAEHAPTADDQDGEGDFSLGVHFPYDLSRAKSRAMVFRGYPAADRAVLELARAALLDLQNDAEHDHPLLLVLSLSAFDYVAHVHGPDSWESWETLRALDQELARFFADLHGRFGERLGIVLSADHGTVPLPETAGNERARPWCAGAAPDPYERPCNKGERLYRDDLEQRLQTTTRAAFGARTLVRGVIEPFAYFTPEAAALPPARRALLEKLAISALEKHPGVARVFATRSFAASCPTFGDDSLEALVCRSLPPGAGDLYIVPRPGSFFDPNLVRAHGINHGTPYLYDRTVPMFAWAASHELAGRRIARTLRPADFTATAAALLRIDPPSGARDGRNLLGDAEP